MSTATPASPALTFLREREAAMGGNLRGKKCEDEGPPRKDFVQPKQAISMHSALVVALCGAALAGLATATTPCFHLSECNGHGVCQDATATCACFDGWGSPSDVAIYKAPDCSQRTCDPPPNTVPDALQRTAVAIVHVEVGVTGSVAPAAAVAASALACTTGRAQLSAP